MTRDWQRDWSEISDTIDHWSTVTEQAERWGGISGHAYVSGFLQSRIKSLIMDLPKQRREEVLEEFRQSARAKEHDITFRALRS